MIDEIIGILNEYNSHLDREYDNDLVLLTEKIISDLGKTKNDIKALNRAIPNDIPNEIVEKLKKM